MEMISFVQLVFVKDSKFWSIIKISILEFKSVFWCYYREFGMMD